MVATDETVEQRTETNESSDRLVAWTGTEARFDTIDGEEELDEHYEATRDIPMWIGSKTGSIKVLGTSEGLSKEYVFGQGTGPEDAWIKTMTSDDAAILLSMPTEAGNFRDVTHDPGFFVRFYRTTDEIFNASNATNGSDDLSGE